MPIRRKARPGEFLRQCDRTGFTCYASETMKEWNGAIVWNKVFEARNAQDFIRGIPDDSSVKDARPVGIATFTGPLTTEINATQAAGDTSLTLLDTTRMAGSDRLGIALDNGDMFLTTVSSIDSDTAITVADKLPNTTSAGKIVIDYSAIASATLE